MKTNHAAVISVIPSRALHSGQDAFGSDHSKAMARNELCLEMAVISVLKGLFAQ